MPGLIAAFDIGTTETKAVLLDRERGVVYEHAYPYATQRGADGCVEQQPDDWWVAVCQAARAFWQAGWAPRSVEAIGLTGQMQDVIAVDGNQHALRPAILYSDTRAGRHSEAAIAILREHGVSDADLTHLDAASPLAKLLWLREHEPERLAACDRVLFNAKDYALARLTGVCVTDATTAATTGCFDLHTRAWRSSWLDLLGLPQHWLPSLLRCSDVAGTISADAAEATGFLPGTPVYAGMGDAAAATLAAGLIKPGETYLYLGTTGWAATLAELTASGDGADGLWRLPYITPDHIITIAPLLNTGSAHQWIMTLLEMQGSSGAETSAWQYDRFERLLRATPERSGGALFLPYLNGERCPVHEPRAMGTFLRLGPHSGRGQMAWAVLEGICFALRQVLETLGSQPRTVRTVGGMARSPLLAQLLADVCGRAVRAMALPGTSGAVAAAVPIAVERGWFDDVRAAIEAWLDPGASGDAHLYPAAAAQAAHYDALYHAYLQIYPLVSRIAGGGDVVQ